MEHFYRNELDTERAMPILRAIGKMLVDKGASNPSVRDHMLNYVEAATHSIKHGYAADRYTMNAKTIIQLAETLMSVDPEGSYTARLRAALDEFRTAIVIYKLQR